MTLWSFSTLIIQQLFYEISKGYSNSTVFSGIILLKHFCVFRHIFEHLYWPLRFYRTQNGISALNEVYFLYVYE